MAHGNLSMEEPGLFHLLDHVRRNDPVDPIVLHALYNRGLVCELQTPRLTSAGREMLQMLRAKAAADFA